MDRAEVQRIVDELGVDVAIGLKGAHDSYVFLERRIGVLEAHRDGAIAKHASHEATLAERQRSADRAADESRENRVDIAKLEEAIDQLKELPVKLEKLVVRIEALEKGGDAAEVKKAKQLSLGGGALAVAMFIGTIIAFVIKSLMEGGQQ